MLAEMLLNSTFDAAAIEREKGTILQEMEVVEKVEEEVVFDNCMFSLPDTPLSLPLSPPLAPCPFPFVRDFYMIRFMPSSSADI